MFLPGGILYGPPGMPQFTLLYIKKEVTSSAVGASSTTEGIFSDRPQ